MDAHVVGIGKALVAFAVRGRRCNRRSRTPARERPVSSRVSSVPSSPPAFARRSRSSRSHPASASRRSDSTSTETACAPYTCMSATSSRPKRQGYVAMAGRKDNSCQPCAVRVRRAEPAPHARRGRRAATPYPARCQSHRRRRPERGPGPTSSPRGGSRISPTRRRHAAACSAA